MQWSVYKVMAGEAASSSDVTNGARQQRQQAVEDKLPRPELCLVPGCTVRLADEGVRSTRVKVCAAHQKCGSVVVEGEASRFCQQCVRFHPLADYDGDRKGCRRSLKLHNMRRKRRAAELRGSSVVVMESKCHDETPQLSPDVVVPTRRGRKEARRDAQRSDSSAAPTTLQTSSSSQPFPCAPNLDELSGECSGLYVEPDYWISPLLGLSVEMSPADCSRATSSALLAEVSTPGDTSLVGGAAAVINTPFSRPNIRYQWPDALLERSLELWEGGPGDETLHSCVGPGCAICSTYNTTIRQPPHQLASWTADTTDSSSDLLAPIYPDLDHPHHLGFTAKIHHVTPYDLPCTMRDDLSSMLQGLPMSMEGAIRPGCVMLSLDCWFKSRTDCQAALASFMATLGSATTGTSRLPWGPHDADIYLPNFVALLRNGSVLQWKPRSSAGPTIVSCHTCASATGELSLAVKGAAKDDFKLLARLNGTYFEADIVTVDRSPDGTLSIIQARVPTQNPGLLWFEFLQDAAPTSHALLSPSVPVLLTHRADVAQEVSMYTLTKHKPASQELVATLKALDETLYFDKAALPQLEQWCTAVQLAAMLGWQATLAVIFEEADEYGFLQDYVTELNQRCNLVASAALSGCLETMIQVIMVLEQAEIPLSVSNEMVINGVPFTALHIAAMQGAADVCRMLCSLCPEASLAWDTVLGGPSEQTPAAIIVHRRLIHRNSQPSSSIKAEHARAPEFDASEKTKHSPEIDGYQLEKTQQDVVPSRFHSIAWHIRDWKFACVTFLLFLVIGYNQGMRELEGTMLSALLTAVLHIGVPLYATHHFTVCAHAHEEARERGMELERNTLYFVDSDVRADFMQNSRLSRVFPNSHHFLFLLCVMWPLGLASEEPLSLLRFMYVVFLLPGAILPCLGLTCASAQGILWVNVLLDASTQVAPALSCWLSNIDAPEPVLTQPPGNPPFLTCLAFLLKSLMNVSICAAVRGLVFRYPSRWMHMGQTIVAACLPLSFLQRYVYSGGCAACTAGALPTLLLLPLLSLTSILVSLHVRHDMERSRVLTYLLNYTSTSKPKQA